MSRIKAALLVTAGAGALLSCTDRGGGKAAPGRPMPLVTVTKVEPRDLPITMRAPVDLRPLAQADVGSKTLGYLGTVLVDRGDPVKRGQLVALVRPSDLPDQLAGARSALAQAQASTVLARTNFQRAQTLAPSAVVSQQELQQAQAALASAEAQEATTRAQIGALGVRLGEMRIESPLTGVVSARRLDPGALVGPTAGAILTVVRMDVLRVFVTVHEKNASGVAVGRDAFVELDALPGHRFGGKVVRVAPAFDPTTRTLDAEVQLTNESNELRPGMYGRATVVMEVRPQALVVPIGAVQIANDRHFVFVHQASVVRRRPVTIGFEGETFLEVTKGLTAGEEIVVTGIDLLTDGGSVRTVPEPKSGVAETKPANPAPPP